MQANTGGRPGDLTVRLDEDGDSLAVRVAGELDIATAPALESALLHALDSGAASILVDLERVSFIDSMGLRVLVWAGGNPVRTGIAFASTADRASFIG